MTYSANRCWSMPFRLLAPIKFFALSLPFLGFQLACSSRESNGPGGASAGATASGGAAGSGGTSFGGSTGGASGSTATSTSGASSGGVTAGGNTGAGGAQGGSAGTIGNEGGMGGSTAGNDAGGTAGTAAGMDAGGTSASGMGGAAGTMAGSSEAGTSAGGMGGASDQEFQPCPEMSECKILPLGDSITFGLGFSGGYRVELFRLALQDDHEITFTGTQQPNGPNMVEGVPFPRDHEGISGETIQQIDNRVPSPALDEMPHIVLLHAGTNDMSQSADGADMRLAALLDELIEEAPDALIVVSSIIPLSFGGGAVDAFNATIPGMVEERANAGAHIIYADQFTGFPTSELGDGVHPNEQGYARMGRVWYEAISPYLR